MNDYYKDLIRELTPADILPGAMENLNELRANGILVAVGSSSKNTPLILRQIGLFGFFDAVSDGNNISRSKPDPEVFLKAAQMLGTDPAECLVVEDADAGIEAGRRGGMKTLSVKGAKGADYFAPDLSEYSIFRRIIR